MPQPMTILVGTMTGTAELIAQEVAEVAKTVGYTPIIKLMDQLLAEVFEPGGVFLIVSSTYGNGDVPDNARAFFADLETRRPQLSRVVYGLIALGDMTYKATFCQGGLQFDGLLTQLGAKRVGAPLMHDASGGTLAEDDARKWFGAWLHQQLEPALAA